MPGGARCALWASRGRARACPAAAGPARACPAAAGQAPRAYNAATRRKCYQCRALRPEAAGGRSVSPLRLGERQTRQTWCGCDSTFANKPSCHRCGAAQGASRQQAQVVAAAPKTPSAPVRKRSPSAAHPQAAGASTFAVVLKVEVAKSRQLDWRPWLYQQDPSSRLRACVRSPGS